MGTSENIQTSPEELLDIQFGISKAISEVADPLAILDLMLDQLGDIHGVDAVGVYFWSEEERRFVLRESFGLDLDAGNELAVVDYASWDEIAVKLKKLGFLQVISWPISSNGDSSGHLVSASYGKSGLKQPVQSVLKTMAANLSGMVVHSKTEAALRTSRHNLETVFQKSEDYLFVLDKAGRIITCNACQMDKLGYSKADIINKQISKISPDLLSIFEDHDGQLKTQVLNDKGTIHQGYLLGKNESPVLVEIRISQGRWDDEDVWYVICRDIDDHMAMEQERNRLAKAIEHISESVVITEADGAIIYTNPAFSELTGYTREEALGSNPRILKSGNQPEEYYRELWETISRGQTWNGRFENCKKDGTELIEDASITPVLNDNGIITHFIGVKRDVSLEIAMEQKLRASQKLEAIGTLAGGIAHDFNNILYALLGYGQLALDDIPEDHPAHVPLQEICKAGERATDLVDKMLTFGRRSAVGREATSLKPIVEEALGLARASLPSTIEFEIDLQDNLSPVLANHTQIHQIVLNMCTNAEHALRNTSGTLSVTLKEIEWESDKQEKFANLPSGKWISLEFSDTGMGMNPAVIDRIFEPYFTTKKPNEGTGLGLATAHGIIQNHEGHIYVESIPNQGTVFTIFLPVSSKAISGRQETVKKDIGIIAGDSHCKGNIMIIDDEQMIVDILCKALPRMGYDVTGFTEGIKALEVFRVSPGAYDMVITDQTMPHITGFEVAAELLSIRPDLPIILTTGYADQAGEEQAKSVGISKFVSKPLKISELSVLIEDLLSETAKV